jgi:hypothetical protein
MESLESKLERLAPDQRREVEDFIDFLLSRSGTIRDFSGTIPAPPPLMNGIPPPLTMVEPVRIARGAPNGESGQVFLKDSEFSSPVHGETSGGIQEIVGGNDDGFDQHYIDYGRFEKPSPATEAVLKIKEKIVKRHEQERKGHILEWID